eukprot:2734708-Ditylum_brightwellii.AAC.1
MMHLSIAIHVGIFMRVAMRTAYAYLTYLDWFSFSLGGSGYVCGCGCEDFDAVTTYEAVEGVVTLLGGWRNFQDLRVAWFWGGGDRHRWRTPLVFVAVTATVGRVVAWRRV